MTAGVTTANRLIFLGCSWAGYRLALNVIRPIAQDLTSAIRSRRISSRRISSYRHSSYRPSISMDMLSPTNQTGLGYAQAYDTQ